METCRVKGCTNEAIHEVILYDFYPSDGTVFFEQDHTCAFICAEHAIENEEKARGEREPRGGGPGRGGFGRDRTGGGGRRQRY